MLWKIRPENFVGDYLTSKQLNCKRKIWPTMSNSDLHLEICRAKLHRIEKHLQHKREEYARRRVHLDAVWSSMEDDETKLQENFIAFNQFIISNKDKRIRALQDTECSRKLIELRDKEIEKLKENIEHLQLSKKELDANVAQYRIYEDYLKKVQELGAGLYHFQNIDSIVECYECYMQIANDLVERQATAFQILQNEKSRLEKFTENNKEALLALHTRAVSFQGRYEDVVRRTRQMEVLVSRIRNHIKDKYTDIKTAKESAWNLYNIMCAKKHATPKIPKDDFEKQLIFINHTIKQYQKLNSELKKILQKKRSKKQ